MSQTARVSQQSSVNRIARGLRKAALGLALALSLALGGTRAVAQETTPPPAPEPTQPAPAQPEVTPNQPQPEVTPYQPQPEPAQQPQSQPAQPQSAPVQAQPQPMPAEAQPAPVEVPRKPTPFDRHRIRLSLGLGGGSYGGSGFFAVEIGAGYYVISGLEVGFDVSQWFGSTPAVTQISPQLRYVFYQLLRYVPIAPYVGAFYRHWFLWDGFPDYDTLGGRAGAILTLGGRVYFGLGVVYERILSDCGVSCDKNNVYPELTVAISF